MKKLAAALSAALILSLAAPAFAAIEFSGKLENSFELHDKDKDGKWQVDGKTGIDIQADAKAEGGNAVKAVVKLKPLRFKDGYDDDDKLDGSLPFENSLSGIALQNIAIDKAWIETTGPFWHGGPAVRTQLGDVNVEWNPIIAELGDKRGITVEGMRVGPATAKAFYAWEGAASRPMGVAAEATIDGVNVSGLLVRKGTENNYLVGAGMNVMPGLEVSGAAAFDGANRYLYRVQATATDLVPGVKVSAAYRAADDAFAPMYTVAPEDKDGNPVPRNDRKNVHYDLLDGFSVAAETVQSGVRLKAEYDQPHQEANLAADTEIEGFQLAASTTLVGGAVEETKVSVARSLNLAGFAVDGEYTAKIVPGNPTKHKLAAKTKTSVIRQLQDLGLSAEVELAGSDITWSTAAEYTAPNGIDLGAKYHSKDGASAKAGVTVEF